MLQEPHAPYNFVPFSQRVLEYPWGDSPPAFSAVSPDLLTGQIAVTMTAVTPVCIGTSASAGFFRTPDNRYAIPGSSFRGLIRENMQILGHGRIRTANDLDIASGIAGSGLPPAHQERKLDLVTAILGYANLDLETRGRPESHRSRVSFGCLYAVGTAQPTLCQLLLMAPRPRACKNYYRSDRSPRGYKQFWLKPAEWKESSSKIASRLAALPAGTRFQGTLTFRNLHSEELGLLLWALRLEDGCFQPIGRGKPYGFGRTTLTIDALHLMQPERFYASLTATLTPANDRIDELIRRFRSLSRTALGDSCEQELEDFFYIRRTQRSDGYLSAAEEVAAGGRLPTIAELRERETAQPFAPEDLQQGMAALLAKFGSGVSAGSPDRKKKRGR